MTKENSEDDELQHYGVPGMKWGVRRNNSRNPDYSNNQRRRDRQIYGRGGERRINRKLNRGDNISLARGDEKTRRDRVMGNNKYARQAGKVVGGIGAIAIANVGLSVLRSTPVRLAGAKLISRLTGGSQAGLATFRAIDDIGKIANSAQGRIIISAGAAKVGTMLAGDAGVAINMRANGYDPSRR